MIVPLTATAPRAEPLRAPERPAREPASEPAAPAATPVPDAVIDPRQIEEAARRVNSALRQFSVELRYRVDDATRKTVVQVVDPKTEQVIRQIPAEETLAIARGLDRMQGLLLSRKA